DEATVSIIVNPLPPEVGVNAIEMLDTTVLEGENLVYKVELEQGVLKETRYDITFGQAGDSATEQDVDLNQVQFTHGVTYDADNNQIVVPVGVGAFSVLIPTVIDGVYEVDESFTLTLDGKNGTGIIENIDEPTLLVTKQLEGDEDSQIELNISLADDHGIEYVVITNIPENATLKSDGNDIPVVDGEAKLTLEQLYLLSVTPPNNSDEDFELSVAGYSQQDILLEQHEVDITVIAVTDKPLLTIADPEIISYHNFDTIDLDGRSWRGDVDSNELTSADTESGIEDGAEGVWGTDNNKNGKDYNEVGKETVYRGKDGEVGNNIYELEGRHGDDQLYTQFSGEAGQFYNLSFDIVARRVGDSPATVFLEDSQGNRTVLYEYTNEQSNTWNTESINFATSEDGQYKIVFESETSANSVGALLDNIKLETRDNLGYEDSDIPLSDIEVNLQDRDGSETLTVQLDTSDFPDGTTIKAPNGSVLVPDQDGIVDITAWKDDLSELFIHVPEDGNYTLDIVVSAQDNAPGVIETVTQTLNVTVLPVAQSNQITLLEDQETHHILTIEEFGVTDLNATLFITAISETGVYEIQTSDDVWETLSARDRVEVSDIVAGNVRFKAIENESGFDGYTDSGEGNLKQDYSTISFVVEQGDTRSDEITLTIDIEPVADQPQLSVETPTIDLPTQFFNVFKWADVEVNDKDDGDDKGKDKDDKDKDDDKGKDKDDKDEDDDKDKDKDDKDEDDDKGKDKDDKDKDDDKGKDKDDKDEDDDKDKDEDDKDDDKDKDKESSIGDGVSGSVLIEALSKLDPDSAEKSTTDNVQETSKNATPVNTAVMITGLIYLEAGKGYDFTGKADDSLAIKVGGQLVDEARWGEDSGQIKGDAFTPTVSGYYPIEIYHHNQSGPGNFDVNVSIDGAEAIDLSNSALSVMPDLDSLYDAELRTSDLKLSDGKEMYEVYSYNEGLQDTEIPLSRISAALTDTDGSESLTVKLTGLPRGAELSDGDGKSVTVNDSGTVDVTDWNLDELFVLPPEGSHQDFVITVIATSKEAHSDSMANISMSINVKVDALSELVELEPAPASIISQGDVTDTITLHGDDDLKWQEHKGNTGKTENTVFDGTAHIDNYIDVGNGGDYVETGSGNDEIYLGDSEAVNISGKGLDTEALALETFEKFIDGEDVPMRKTDDIDIAYAGAGDDKVYGQGGMDAIDGESGNDQLYGGAGVDALRGGLGNDILVGGDDEDIFIWGDEGEERIGEHDTIKDFEVGIDKIVLEELFDDSSSMSDLLEHISIDKPSGPNGDVILHLTDDDDDEAIDVTITLENNDGQFDGYSTPNEMNNLLNVLLDPTKID
ncbi:hypothetical protein DZ860_20365, partial [Vibrio sinensis]